MKHGNVRLMHSNRAIGRIFQEDYEIRDKGVYAGVSIPLHQVDVQRDIDAGILQCFSLGWDSKNGGIVWAEKPGDYTRFTEIKIGEVTICDSGATPDTEISQERGLVSTLFQRVKKIFDDFTGNSNSGTGPEKEEIEMTKEELMAGLKENNKDLAKGIVDGLAAALQPTFERMQKPADPPKPPEVPKGEVTLEAIQKLIVDNQKPITDRMDKFERSITNSEPLGPVMGDMEKGMGEIEAMLAELEKAPKASEADFALSFVRCRDGSPLTLEKLTAKDPR
jgi:hypothetical protein